MPQVNWNAMPDGTIVHLMRYKRDIISPGPFAPFRTAEQQYAIIADWLETWLREEQHYEVGFTLTGRQVKNKWLNTLKKARQAMAAAKSMMPDGQALTVENFPYKEVEHLFPKIRDWVYTWREQGAYGLPSVYRSEIE